MKTVTPVAGAARSDRLALLVGIVLFMAAGRAAAVPSLDPKDSLTVEYPLNSGNNYVLLCDADDAQQWYVMPNQPRLASRLIGNEKVPIFSLIRYGFRDPNDAAKTIDGGVLQFSSVMDVPGTQAKEEFKKAILQRLGAGGLGRHKQRNNFLRGGRTASDISISTISFKKADIALYAVAGGGVEKGVGKFVAKGSRASGVAPQFPSQQMPFTLELTKLGTSFYEGLFANSASGGLQVIYTVTYQGMTPEVGFEVTADWSSLQKHVDKDQGYAAELAGNLFGKLDVGLKYQKSTKEVVDELIKKDIIKVKLTAGDGLTEAEATTLMKPILDDIRKDIFGTTAPFPTEIKPDKAATTRLHPELNTKLVRRWTVPRDEQDHYFAVARQDDAKTSGLHPDAREEQDQSFAVATQAAANPKPALFQVTVVAKSGGKAVQDVDVTVTKEGKNDQDSTDAAGKCKFKLAPGAYEVKLEKKGFKEKTEKLEVTKEAELTIELTSGASNPATPPATTTPMKDTKPTTPPATTTPKKDTKPTTPPATSTAAKTAAAVADTTLKKFEKAVPSFKFSYNDTTMTRIKSMKGTKTYVYSSRRIQDYTTVIAGFLSMGDYIPNKKTDPKGHEGAVAKYMPIITDSEAFDNTYFLLPEVPAELLANGVNSVRLTVFIIDKNGHMVGGEPRVAEFKVVAETSANWTSGGTEPVSKLAFPLGRLRQDYKDKDSEERPWKKQFNALQFAVGTQILRNGENTLRDSYKLSVKSDGVLSAQDSLDTRQISLRGLHSFGEDMYEGKPGLSSLDIKLSATDHFEVYENGKLVQKVNPRERTVRNIDASTTDKDIYFFVQKGAKYDATITFHDARDKTTKLTITGQTDDLSINEEMRANAK